MLRRYLSIDLGDRRTGIAVGDAVSGIVNPVEVIHTTSQAERLRRIVVVIREYEPQAIVVGLPLNMDGTRGPAAKGAQALAEALGVACGLPVHLFDERLTSWAADQQMSRSGLTHKGKRELRDALAAAVILRDFFAAQAANQGGESPEVS